MGNKQGGFIQLIIIIALLIVIMSLLGVSLSSLINNKTIKENFAYVFNGIVWVWDNYLAGAIVKLWGLIKNSQ